MLVLRAKPATDPLRQANVAVHVTGQAGTNPLAYDESCAGPNSRHYDDRTTQIVLCPATCDALRTGNAAKIDGEFAREPLS